MFSCIAASLFVSFGRNSTEFVGLGLVYSLQVTGLLQWTVRTFIETENNLVSVQRLSRYTDSIPVERYEDESNASSSWPTQGLIRASNVKMKYRENLPEVLRDVSFEIRDGEKIGICGRTGSGKSSLFSTLLRIVESHSGKITIDGVDISKVGLEKTAQLDCVDSSGSCNVYHSFKISLEHKHTRILYITQVLFSGTIRRNLDPFDKYKDQDILSALQRVHLESLKLDSVVKERGENYSVGERQLLCFARVLLRTNCKIILMDEATANVDTSTDHALQKMIREVFRDKTVLCIAHRLDTILGCDRIMVMDQGRVVEFDTVKVLSEKRDGHFASLRHEMSFSGDGDDDRRRRVSDLYIFICVFVRKYFGSICVFVSSPLLESTKFCVCRKKKLDRWTHASMRKSSLFPRSFEFLENTLTQREKSF